MLSYIYFFVIFISLVIGIFRWKSLDPASLKIFLLYLTIVFVIEVTGYTMVSNGHSNGWPYNIYIFLHLVFLSLLFFFSLRDRLFRTIILLLFILGLFQTVFNFLGNDFRKFNQIAFIYNLFIVILYSLLYFTSLLIKPKQEPLHLDGLFWICCGLLLQSIVIVFFIGPYQVSFIKYEIFAQQLKIILKISNIVTYSIFGFAFLLCKTYPKI